MLEIRAGGNAVLDDDRDESLLNRVARGRMHTHIGLYSGDGYRPSSLRLQDQRERGIRERRITMLREDELVGLGHQLVQLCSPRALARDRASFGIDDRAA